MLYNKFQETKNSYCKSLRSGTSKLQFRKSDKKKSESHLKKAFEDERVFWPQQIIDSEYGMYSTKRGRKTKSFWDDWQYYLLISLMLICLLFLSYCALQDNPASVYSAKLNTEFLDQEKSESIDAFTSIKEDMDKAPNVNQIVVYISGAVQKPGVYELEEGSIVNDLLMMAGGFRDDANPNTINLAAELVNNSHIYVQENTPNTTIQANNLYDLHRKDNNQEGLISLNYSSKNELMTVPGIGPATAQAIINFREQSGQNMLIEDLLKIPGIKEKRFEQISPYFALP